MANLILVKNKVTQREEMVKFFQENNHLVSATSDLGYFQKNLLHKNNYIAIIELLPNVYEKLDFIRKLRRENSAIGIIIHADVCTYFIEGMDAGADHFHGHPTHFPELLACVNALARRLGVNAIDEPWVIDQQNRVLIAPEGSIVTLSARDFSVLRTLITWWGQTVTRRQIVLALGEDFMTFDQRRLDTQIRRLRVKAEEQLGSKLPVNTVHGVGYVFSAAAVIIN